LSRIQLPESALRTMVCVAGAVLLSPVAAASQRAVIDSASLGAVMDTASQWAATDTTSLATGSSSEATALLEKTLFRIDVARLRVRFGPETAREVSDLLVQGLPEGDREILEDALALRVLRATDAWATLRFERGVGFERFIDGIRDGVEVALQAGYVDPSFARGLSDSLPVWYAHLRERGVREGDVMMYRIRGDTLRTVFRTVEGDVAVDQTDVGTQPRLAVLGGFFGPGSDFREGLLESLLAYGSREGEEKGGPPLWDGVSEEEVRAPGPARGGA